MSASFVPSVSGVRVPDSKLARDATEVLREHGTPLLFAHSQRVYLFGTLQGRRRGWAVDPELFYVAAVFHDLGLTPGFRTREHRFEVDGANAARDFLRTHGLGEAAQELVWDAIALHTTLEIPWHKRPEVALLNGGTALDVIGRGLDEIPTADRDAVLAAYPRGDFACGVVRAFADGLADRPRTAFGTFNADILERSLPGYRRTNFCDLIAANPLGG